MKPGKAIRNLIFVYFLLLVFEGALRFWVFPGLSSVLMLVRDPVVCVIYFLAIANGRMPRSIIIGLTVVLTLVSGGSSFMVGDAPWLVTVYGLRANYLHLPLIYVMRVMMTVEDVQRVGRWLMWLMIPMALLVVYQFRSPPGSWINLGGMPTQYGTVRPAGTFAFVSGMVCFSSLVAAFLADSFVNGVRQSLFLKVGCSAAVLASLAVSGSRSSILAVAIVFVMLAGLSLFNSRAARGTLVLVGVIGLGIASMTSTEFFEEGQRQLAQRFKDASQGKGVMESSMERFIGMFNYPIWAAQSAPPLGHGLGTGTNVGYFLVTGQRGFGGGQETELGRIMYEMGAIFGSIFILLRLAITLQMLRDGWKALGRSNLLPMLLFGAAGMNVMLGIWGIANTQGFATFGAGLCLAAARIGLKKRLATPAKNES
ncbi:MAG: hypothetical protein ACOYOF_22160, partial [Verrucomicrobiaceae bacterium]